MDDGGDDMAGRFVGELDDVFAEVGFDYAQAGVFEGVVEVNLLGCHGLGLDDQVGAVLEGDILDDGLCVLDTRGPVDGAAVAGQVGLELLEVVGPVAEDVLLHLTHLGTQLLSFDCAHGVETRVGHTVGGLADGDAEIGVAQGLFDAVFVGGVDVYLHGGGYLVAGRELMGAGTVIRPSGGGGRLVRARAATAGAACCRGGC